MARIDWDFGGLQNSTHQTKTPQGRCFSMQNCTVDNGILEVSKRYGSTWTPPNWTASCSGWGLGYGRYSGNEVQTITVSGTPTSGYFTLTWNGQTTSRLDYNATKTQIQTALEGLSNINMGDVRVTGGPLPTVKGAVTFQGQYANTNVSLMTSSATGLTITIAESIRGGTSEEYLAVIQYPASGSCTLYSVNTSGAWTTIANGLAASNWFFDQYRQKVYAVNAGDGLNFKILGQDQWNGQNSGVVPPSPPSLQLTPTVTGAAAEGIVYTGATLTSSGFASTPTLQTGSNGGGNNWSGVPFIVILGSASEVGKTVSVTVTLASAINLSHNDWFEAAIFGSGVGQVEPTHMDLSLQNSAGTSIDLPYKSTGTTNSGFSAAREFQCADGSRTDRQTVKKFIATLSFANAASGSVFYVRLNYGKAWMNDTTDLNMDTGPTKEAISYAYTFVDTADDVESKLSPTVESIVFPSTHVGAWMSLSASGSAELGLTGKLYFYRKEKSTGKWRRLPNADGTEGLTNSTSGMVVYVDKWMEHELQDFTAHSTFSFPGTESTIVADQVGVWKQCLVIGASKQAWISYVGQPENFVASPDDTTASLPGDDELDRGKTVYVSDNRSEDVYGIVGEDSLYLVTPFSCYAIVGDTPADSTPPRRLPGSRGGVGSRASNRLGGGVIVASNDGLWYFSVSAGFSGQDNGSLIKREETADVRRSYTALSSGSPSASVVIEHEDEVWIFNGRKYLCNTRNKNWIEGTFSDSVKAALSVRDRGLRFMDSTGRIHLIGSSYTTDAGSSVTWSYTTGILDSERTRIRGLEIRGSGRAKATVTTYRGLEVEETTTYQAERVGQNWLKPILIKPGFRYKLTLEGTNKDTVEFFALEVDEASPAKGS